jgi:hypothetical protein
MYLRSRTRHVLVLFFNPPLKQSQIYISISTLKGLSHEIDFKNVDKNLQNFLRAPMILKRKKYIFCG